MPDPRNGRLRRIQFDARDDLVRRIKIAQVYLAKKIHVAAANSKITNSKFQEAFFGKVRTHYEHLEAELDSWGKDLVKTTAVDWHKIALSDIKSQVGKSVQANVVRFNKARVDRYWSMIHPDTVHGIAATFTDKMSLSDVSNLRTAIVDTTRQRVLEGWNQNTFQKALQARWSELSGNLASDRFVDSAGRKWTNAHYLSTLARTTTARIARDSYFDTLIEHGDDLAMIIPSGDSCPICRAWANLIISISGANQKYPSYADARAGGMFHPNCDCMTRRMDEAIDEEELADQEGADNAKDWGDVDQVKAYRDNATDITVKTPFGD